ncbi:MULTISPECIES: hypothetical protein [Bacillus]|uniref:Uncharacterized protein n=1 Tax=Bacillus subtilis TaxID=1423 RepID=A0AAQ3EQS5_BACIU|nr:MULTISPECIES: hypothetical protein [Bacillus]KIN36757.1 hypothetical protein B4071_2081 [Bacillus subtilis]MBO3767145.1 hypothetical protein [Bacillus subtilis]MDP8528097.1 hypothetical protein [Bacillus subtilis]ODV46597.1 hypothetical protein BCM26_14585 [Bacillus subtilis]OJH62437.1 hypothetical protein BOH71_15365 [Bacillus subtilis]
MSEQKLRIGEIRYEVYNDYDPFTEEYLGKKLGNAYFIAEIEKENVAQVGNRKINYSNEVKIGFDAFGEETKEKIKEHLLAAYSLIAEGAKDDGLVEYL